MENVVYCAYLKQTYKSYANASSWSYRASTATPLRKTIQAAASLLAHTWRRSSISVRDLNSKRPFLMSHSCCAWMCLLKEVYWFWIKKKNKFKYRGAGLYCLSKATLLHMKELVGGLLTHLQTQELTTLYSCSRAYIWYTFFEGCDSNDLQSSESTTTKQTALVKPKGSCFRHINNEMES